MNAATAIREQVRMLALEIGEKAAAEKLGIQYARVRQWSHRYAWKKTTVSPQALVTTVTRPSVILADELADNERETRLSLSRYAKRAAKDSESCSLKEAPYVKAAAQVAGIAHRWGSDDKPSHFTLNMLNINSLVVDTPEQSE